MVMIMMIVNMVMVMKIFHHLVCFCLSQVSKSLNLISEGLKYPPEVRVGHKTYSTIRGTPLQVTLNQNNLTGLAGGVREGQNMAQNAARAVNPMQNCWLRSPVEAPKWLKDTRNGPQTISQIHSSLFPESLTYLGASRGLQSQKFCIYLYKRGQVWAIFWPFLTPHCRKPIITTNITLRWPPGTTVIPSQPFDS